MIEGLGVCHEIMALSIDCGAAVWTERELCYKPWVVNLVPLSSNIEIVNFCNEDQNFLIPIINCDSGAWNVSDWMNARCHVLSLYWLIFR